MNIEGNFLVIAKCGITINIKKKNVKKKEPKSKLIMRMSLSGIQFSLLYIY